MSLRKFEILELIAKGGMAEVYRAQTTGPEGFAKELCVKKILPHLTEDEKFVRMFINEAKLAATLNFANIVSVHDLCVSANREYFIVMEYVHGKDLSDIIRAAQIAGRTIPIEMACYIGREICRGLGYAHSKKDRHGAPLNIIHRDISPQNVLCSFMGEIKITDFGIAKASTNHNKTAVGILKGKYGYMSPEQAHGKELDHRSDLFNLGIVMYEMLLGERCFAGTSDYSTLNLMREAVVTPPSRINANIPKALEDIVLKALARRPEDRFQSASEFEESLKTINQQNLASDLAKFVTSLFSSPQAQEGERSTGILNLASVVAPMPADDTDKDKIPKLEKEIPAAPAEAKNKESQHAEKKSDKIQERAAKAENKKPVGRQHLKPGWTGLNSTFRTQGLKLVFKMAFASAAALLLGFVLGSSNMRGQSYERAFLQVENSLPSDSNKPQMSSLLIETIPSGAKIRIDDQAKAQKTPLILHEFPANSQHRIELSLKGHQGLRKQFQIKNSGLTRIRESLKADKANLQLKTDGAGASVYIDGVHQGDTPLELFLAAGTHVLELKQKDHLTFYQTIEVGPDVPLAISKTMTPSSRAARIIVGTDIPAQIFLNERPVGFSNSGQYLSVEPDQTLTLKLKGLNSNHHETLQIKLQANERQQIYVTLQRPSRKKPKK